MNFLGTILKEEQDSRLELELARKSAENSLLEKKGGLEAAFKALESELERQAKTSLSEERKRLVKVYRDIIEKGEKNIQIIEKAGHKNGDKAVQKVIDKILNQ